MFDFIWIEILKKPLFNTLIFFEYLTGDLGIAIILLTLLLKFVLIPLTIPQIKMAQKRTDLKDELDSLKEKYKDKSELAQKQMELYKKHGISPVSGCLPMIVFSIVLLALFRVFTSLFEGTIPAEYYYAGFLQENSIDSSFLYLDLFKKDPFYILPVLTGIAQFFSSKYMLPTVKKAKTVAKETETSMDDMAIQMQSQMIYIFPIMTVFFTINFPAGLALYWFVSSTFSFLQNLIIKRMYKKD